MHYDTNLKKRQTEKHLNRRGLDKPGIDLEAIGIIPLVETHDIDIDLYIPQDTGQVEIKDGKAHVIYEAKPMTGPDITRKMKDKINAKRDRLFAAGYEFSHNGETHKLQTRGAADLVNWQELKADAEAMAPTDTVEIRTAADKKVILTGPEIVAVLSGIKPWRLALLKHSWGIKDQIDAATTEAAAFTEYEAGMGGAWPTCDQF